MDNLDKDLAEMRRLGYTSYGKYKLDHPSTKVETPIPGKPRQCAPPATYRRECTHCGKPFVTADHRQTLCSSDCKVLAAKKRYQEKKRAKKPKQIGQCVICGASFEKIRVTHMTCSKQCYVARNRQTQAAWRKRLKEGK